MKKLFAVVALAALPLSANTFQGAYAGLNASLNQRAAKVKVNSTNPNYHNSVKLNKMHYGFGAQVGYAHTFQNNIFAGAELDFGFAFGKKNKTGVTPSHGADWSYGAKTKLRHRGALSARVGYNFGQVIAYTGIVAAMDSYKNTYTAENRAVATQKVHANGNRRHFAFGPLIGAEYAVSPCVGVGAEARYLANTSKSFGAAKAKVKGYDLALRMNYHF